MSPDLRNYDARNNALIKWLTCLMFMMFAMTTDAVGSVIPVIIKEFHLTMTAAGTFHYVPMAAIGLGAILFGFLADRLGRQRTIVVGLILYGISSVLFAVGSTFTYFVVLLAMAGIGISVFKTGGLALIGDVTKSTTEHSSLMNMVEGFFATGAIIGPAIVATLLVAGFSWKWLYVIAAAICGLLIIVALSLRFPQTNRTTEKPAAISHTLRMMKDPYALAFSTMIMLYVASEVAIYVWMPTYLLDYHGAFTWLPAYALVVFFILRAFGRFLGAWLIGRFDWTCDSRLVWRRDLSLFSRFSSGGRNVRGVSVAGIGIVHVGDLSDVEFQRYQLLSQVRAWGRSRRHSVFHRPSGGAWPPRDGAGQ